MLPRPILPTNISEGPVCGSCVTTAAGTTVDDVADPAAGAVTVDAVFACAAASLMTTFAVAEELLLLLLVFVFVVAGVLGLTDGEYVGVGVYVGCGVYVGVGVGEYVGCGVYVGVGVGLVVWQLHGWFQ
jgi:hypothetical protein